MVGRDLQFHGGRAMPYGLQERLPQSIAFGKGGTQGTGKEEWGSRDALSRRC